MTSGLLSAVPGWRKVRTIIATTLPTTCPYCGRTVYSWQPWDVDHRVPRSRGGGIDWANLRAAHRSCNRAAGAKIRRHAPRGQRLARTLPPSRDW